ncbi:MAG: hypothetical protein JO333_18205 [Verrucomicrobia bacterium]|nr:hypothetical protein [Verrucomicrobiota bacterium]
MKVYQVECRAVFTLAEEDIARAAHQGVAFIRQNPHLIQVKAVHERDRGLLGQPVTASADGGPEPSMA